MRRDFAKEKQFVKYLAASLGIGKDGNRGSIVTFSYNAQLTVTLSDSAASPSPDFSALVDKVPFMGYTTRIDRALTLVMNEMFKKANGARDGVPRVLFVLTDGTQTKDRDAVDPASIASELRRKLGVRLFVIGMGTRVNPAELSLIAGGPSSVFLAKTLNQLQSADFIGKISSSVCLHGTHCYAYCLSHIAVVLPCNGLTIIALVHLRLLRSCLFIHCPHLCVLLFVYVLMCLCVFLFVCLFVCLFLCLCVCLFLCLCVCLFVCLYVHLCVCSLVVLVG